MVFPQDSGWLQVRWRCNDGCVGDVAAEVKPSYEQMDAVARQEAQRHGDDGMIQNFVEFFWLIYLRNPENMMMSL